ncbi:MAG: AMIN domain-containing protein [Desulfuromonadales bacterium]|nr:AMIN domain-containing protein [Desulfuromonadales bacterium]
MKKMQLIPVVGCILGLVSLVGSVLAAELLDVKPVETGSGVLIEVTADIPMTYTFYKVPGQARAIVDIADADPEKVEPLIVVNKGAVSSISVDKVMIGDMTVSRLVFNLVTQSEIFVKHGPDRKTLNVSFGAGKPAAALQVPVAAPAVSVAEPAPVPVAASVTLAEPKEKIPATKIEKDPLGLDEPQPSAVAPVKVEKDPLGLEEPQPAVATPVKDSAPAAVRSTKLTPVVPVTEVQSMSAAVVVKGIVIGASFIDIQTNGPVEKFKQLKLSKPERLLIETLGTSAMKTNSVQVKRFGIAKVRIGTTASTVRIVLDATRAPFPKYEIVSIENGVRIKF